MVRYLRHGKPSIIQARLNLEGLEDRRVPTGFLSGTHGLLAAVANPPALPSQTAGATAVPQTMSVASDTVAMASASIARVVPTAVTSVTPVVQIVVADVVPNLQIVVADVAPIVQTVVADVAPIVQTVVADVAPIVRTAIADVAPIVQTVVADVAPFAQTVVADVAPFAQTVVADVAPIVQTVVADVTSIARTVITDAAPIVQTVNPVLPADPEAQTATVDQMANNNSPTPATSGVLGNSSIVSVVLTPDDLGINPQGNGGFDAIQADFTTGHEVYNAANNVADGNLALGLRNNRDFFWVESGSKDDGLLTSTQGLLNGIRQSTEEMLAGMMESMLMNSRLLRFHNGTELVATVGVNSFDTAPDPGGSGFVLNADSVRAASSEIEPEGTGIFTGFLPNLGLDRLFTDLANSLDSLSSGSPLHIPGWLIWLTVAVGACAAGRRKQHAAGAEDSAWRWAVGLPASLGPLS